VLNPSHSQNPIGETAEFSPGTTEGNYFQTEMGIEVNVEGGDDAGHVPMLVFSQQVGDLPDVVVVNQSEGTHHFLPLGHLLLDESVPDKVTDRLRSIRNPFSPANPVKPGQESPGDRNSEADQRFHFSSPWYHIVFGRSFRRNTLRRLSGGSRESSDLIQK
jgi:hypothetical protein